MMKHAKGTREEWLAARLELLKAEKKLTLQSDALTEQRQKLPWVRIDKNYQFKTEDGPATLKDLFRGRSQLLVYHFMFGPDYAAGCPSCSFIADGFNGFTVHLAQHDVMLWAVSRAPLPKLAAYKRRMGWTFPWASSFEADFNADFSVGFTAEEQFEKGIDYNYRHEPKRDRAASGGGAGTHAAMCGVDTPTYLRERPGMSGFVIEDGVSTTRTRRTPAASMRFGARTNGSIARRKDETSKVHGGSATTSTRREQRAHQRRANMKRTTGYAPVNGLKMYYEIEGDGEPLVFSPAGLRIRKG